jgi:hypothetical protein
MIQQILTSPRPGGAPLGANGQTIGGGIAGVASNADATGIKIYNDRQNYKEWEFIFDPTKIRGVPNPLTGAMGMPAVQLGGGGAPGQPPGTPVTGTGFNPPGSPGSGNSGFTNSGFGSGGSGYGSGGSGYGSSGAGGTPALPTTPPPPVATPPFTFVPDVGLVGSNGVLVKK